MCEACGCGEPGSAQDQPPAHAHDHPHAHAHDHGHAHPHAPAHAPRASGAQRRVLEVERNILTRNDEAAAANRAWLQARGITALNLISAPGTGKTLLLERTLERLAGTVSCAVIAGDQQTDNDARRLSGKGAPVYQIETVSACHLDAPRVGHALEHVVTPETRLVFIENVGNLVCPSAFDLGEAFKVALLSVAEGEDKPVKYPALFSQAPVAVLTKTDLLPHLDFDIARCRGALRAVRPGVYVFELSARTGAGLDAWVDYLATLVA
jgi:hydrogenase nickel incorporation protein HypB